MEKILSVSIASYNVEKFLRKALDSCNIPEILDRLEVLIVNDGSTDGTLEIAREYEAMAPQTFRVIDKENGGYGSTVNASIRAATGKYFRLLDGDDWFDRDGLVKMIGELEQAEEDMIIAQFKRVFEEDGHEELRDEAEDIPETVVRFDRLGDHEWFTMHAITYRTKILQENGIRLTEHCFYTDQEYDLLPLPWVETVRIFPHVVYCYRIGRGEQSVSLEGLEKHYNDQTIVLKRLYTVYPDVGEKKTAKDRYIFNYFLLRTFLQIRVLLVISESRLHKQELKNFIEFLKREQPLIYKEYRRTSKILNILLATRYAAYGILHKRMRKEYRF
ncbi:MAG: glycosyltransferase family 2 protein [Eubacteriales bacterium]|nr:glycosyltransferase family 2 protein [Eubacteriales bacterium]